ncbi:MAG: molybdenum cofactor guanylyltransferase [Candidatus Omnitrophica bacterium]|nr:molybdenum cofactor guanylyltransferase [Candidatus Omnitrophota bacterium]
MIRGLVLAGGKSSRFGSNKAVARYQGIRLVERAVSLLNELSLKPVVAVQKGTGYPFLKCATIDDRLPDRGPLGGLYTAMTVFRNTSFLALTCDMPALTRPVLSELLSRHTPEFLATAYRTQDERVQPFPGVYGPLLLGTIREKLKTNSLSVYDLLDKTPRKQFILWRGDGRIFTNINSARDLRTFEMSDRHGREGFSGRPACPRGKPGERTGAVLRRLDCRSRF